MRRYTVEEVDHLRSVCEDRWLFGTSFEPWRSGFSRQHRSEERFAGVEELVRTAMTAGHTAQDILNADKGKCSNTQS